MQEEDAIAIVGAAAAANIAILQVPQVYRTWKLKDARGLSPLMIGLNITTASLWIAYGVLIGRPPIVLANVAHMGATVALAVMRPFLRGDRAESKGDPAPPGNAAAQEADFVGP